MAEHASVRAASEHIHVTQPAISRQIHDLENELGAVLFERTSRGLKLTEAGQIFLQQARRTLTQIQSAVHISRDAAEGRFGQLRIGFVESAGWDGALPASFSRFQSETPNVRVELVPLNSAEQLAEIANGSLDCGFVNLFEPLPATYNSRQLSLKNVMLAVPQDWPHASLSSGRVSIAYLRSKPVVGFPRAVYPLYYDRMFSACSAAGVVLNVVQEVTTVTAIMALVSAGVGAAIVNSDNRSRPPARVRFFDFRDFSIPIPFCFVSSRSNQNPALSRFDAIVADWET